MFDVGFSELMIIAVVALVVLGPERLPKAARLAGLWIRKARAQWYSVRAELERELAAEEFRKHVRDPLAELQPQMRAMGDEMRSSYADSEAARAVKSSTEPGSEESVDTNSATMLPLDQARDKP